MSSTMKPDVVFVLGAPGAGKGTQCENIVKVSFGMKCNAHVLSAIMKHLYNTTTVMWQV
jgi:broad-specificity NMP kinase